MTKLLTSSPLDWTGNVTTIYENRLKKIVFINSNSISNYYKKMEKERASCTMLNQKIGFIGGGNMARAIFDGIVRKGLVNTNQIYVSGPRIENLNYFKDKGCTITISNGAVVDSCHIIFLSVKPHLLHLVANQINEESKEKWDDKVFVSILAGITIENIESVFKSPINLVRVMPNTAVSVGEGCSVFVPNVRTDLKVVQLIKIILESCGMALEVPENQINAMGALAGSGPAYMCLILEALADGGVKMGIPRANAIKLATQTMLGSAKMVQISGKHSAELKDEVCSAGGSTIAGIHELEKGGVRAAIIDAIEAAAKRSIEMDRTFSLAHNTQALKK
ncbi:hypothetical protein WA026_015766 [Henosepilachna vigintioctopunctata]|uniref:Pyrroline-5-carboxylate reductase n=1 Tax=Henosepilachna vigintioctopunctata TaxID=420089 RepID=A0AAW1UTT9_9CUCU